MYQSYYNLKRKPFQINTDPRFLWLGEKHKEALATLKYGIRDSKGFLLLTGEIGTGKTTLINALLNSLDKNVVEATISDPALSRLEFFQYVALAFDILQPINSKVDFLMHFGRFLRETADQGQKVLLIIDEAQRLTHELLEEIRLLSNLEKQQAKLLDIFFIGQSEFNQVLEDPRNKALRQRISVNYHIDTLSETEVADYIRHRLLIAGSRKVLFSPDAVHQVYLFSGGFPRLINVICDRALLTGYVEDAKQIKAKIIKECARELELPQRKGASSRSRWWPARRRSEMKPGGETAQRSLGRWRPALLGVPALLAAAGLVFFNPDGGHDDPGIPEQLGQIVSELGNSPEGSDPQTGAAKAGAAVTTSPPAVPEPAGEKPPPEGASETEANSPPAVADERPAAGEKENGPPENGGPEEAAVDRKEIGAAPVIIEEILPEEPVVAQTTDAAGSGRDEGGEEKRAASPRRTVAAAVRPGQAGSLPPPAGSARAIRPRNFMINFDIDSNELSPRSFRELERLAQLMQEDQELWAVVIGYTDTSGFYQYNKVISETRANMVKGYLVGRGIAPHKIQTFGKGPENPIASNETQEGRNMNRRVEIELVRGG